MLIEWSPATTLETPIGGPPVSNVVNRNSFCVPVNAVN
jgi:hypothetical protein